MVAVATTSSNVQRILTLRTFPAFASLDPHEIVVMAEHCRDCFFEKGETISKGGVPVKGLHLVVEGRVQILRDGKPYRTMKERESVGGIASITMDPRGLDAVALEDTTTLALEREDMEDVFEDNFAIMVAVMRVLARTLVEAHQKRGPNAGYDTEEVPGEHRVAPLSLMDRIFLLTNSLGFAGANIDAIADLAAGATEARYEVGEHLWRFGEVADHFIRIVSGLVECESPDGSQRFELGVGSMTGGIDALAADPRWYGAVARTPVVGVRVEIADLLDVFEDNVDMGMAMMRVVAHSIEGQYEAMMAAASTTPSGA